MELCKNQTVAISGYKIDTIINLAKSHNVINYIFVKALMAIQDLNKHGYDTFICGLNDGFDIIAAEAALKARERNPNIYLYAAVPSTEADSTTLIPIHGYTELRNYYYMYDKNIFDMQCDYMIEHASYLLCYYDKNSDITTPTIDMAIKLDIPITNVF